jgi:hypothetical protein
MVSGFDGGNCGESPSRQPRDGVFHPEDPVSRSQNLRFAYALRSLSNLDRHHVGLTSDVENRLDWHNHSPRGHAVRAAPDVGFGHGVREQTG